MTKATERKSKLKKKSSNRKSSSSKSVLEAVSSETSAAMTTATKGKKVNTQDVSSETNTPVTPANNNSETIDLCDSPSPQKAENAKISKKQKVDGTSTTITPAAKVDDIMDGNEKEVMVKSATLPPQDVAASTSFKENEVKESSTSKKKKKKLKKSNDTSSAATTTTTDTKQSATTKELPQTKKKKKKKSFDDQILYTMLTSCKPYTLKSLAKATDTTVETLRHAMLSFVDKKLVLTKEFPSVSISYVCFTSLIIHIHILIMCMIYILIEKG